MSIAIYWIGSLVLSSLYVQCDIYISTGNRGFLHDRKLQNLQATSVIFVISHKYLTAPPDAYFFRLDRRPYTVLPSLTLEVWTPIHLEVAV